MIGPGPFFELAAGRADEEETGDALLLAGAEGVADQGVVSRPAGQPAADEAVGMDRVKQVHRRRAD